MSKELEAAMESAGFTMSDSMPTPDAAPQEAVAQPPVGAEASEPAQETPAPAPTPVEPSAQLEETPADTYVQPTQETQVDNVDVDTEVLRFLSEKLGTDINDFDAISSALSNKPVEIDERVAAINKFVMETGRSPEEWYRYQSLNPSEMDEMSLVRLQVQADNPSLTSDDVNLLLSNKYKLDEDYHSEDEIKLSKLQLKMDAEKARKSITELRSSYEAPAVEATQRERIVNDEWIQGMSASANNFGTLDFDLPGKNETFKFGIDDNYRKQLIQKNSRIDDYFNDYIGDNNQWDFNKLNAHRALIDNINSIVSSVYSQGLSDGKRGVVETAANVGAARPAVNQSPDQKSNLEAQLLKALGGGSGMTFNY